jgi:phage shock protein PspC (stress-responsive transcriptional regulator)
MLCPYCRTENRPGATRCAACTSWMVESPPVREWLRPRQGRLLAGVGAGLAARFALPVAAVRAAFILSVVLGGWGVLVYLALWIAMPLEPLLLPPPPLPPQEARAGTAGS